MSKNGRMILFGSVTGNPRARTVSLDDGRKTFPWSERLVKSIVELTDIDSAEPRDGWLLLVVARPGADWENVQLKIANIIRRLQRWGDDTMVATR